MTSDRDNDSDDLIITVTEIMTGDRGNDSDDDNDKKVTIMTVS